jgi:hypothetical protein
LYARLEIDAAASRQIAMGRLLNEQMTALARWWDQFASTEVSDVEGFSGGDVAKSASQVSEAIRAWHEAETAAGDISFWQKHVRTFQSPEAFAMLVETLLDKRDHVASMALLMCWLSQTDEIALSEGEHSFCQLALRWMHDLWAAPRADESGAHERVCSTDERWSLTKKFFDYLEANAEKYWKVPSLDMHEDGGREHGLVDEGEVDETDDLYSAAYEDVTYRDTTDDGFDGSILDGGHDASEFELVREAERVFDRLTFLTTLARLWKLAAVESRDRQGVLQDREEQLTAWLSLALANRQGLVDLMDAVFCYRLPASGGALDALLEYDRRRGIREALLERVIAACVEMTDAVRFILASTHAEISISELHEWEVHAVRALRAMFQGDGDAVRLVWPDLLNALEGQRLLYIPTARGGNPHRVAASRDAQRVLHLLLGKAPRLGLLAETCRLLETAHEMERQNPAGPGAITEFDRLFETGCRGIALCLVESSEEWTTEPAGRTGPPRRSDHQLVECLEKAIELLLKRWLAHSRNIRISVLETVSDDRRWRVLKEFITRYGRDLFTQQFMNLGNLRAILHQGVDRYLDTLLEEPDRAEGIRLLRDLDGPIRRKDAARWLALAIEAVAENYPEYIDYNSTTTQSDRGDLLYTLLDFLRLSAGHERVCWNLKPVTIVHEVMVRCGRVRAAEKWREAVVERTREVADTHLAQFEELCRRYAMRLSSIADRLNERFVRPLDIDRLRALVGPAIEEIRSSDLTVSFEMLENEVRRFTEQPSGVGFDIPAWLEAMENEVDRACLPQIRDDEATDPSPELPQVRLSLEEVMRELERSAKD